MNWEGKKVVVTGGAGFVGSHLAEKLVNLGADVTIADMIAKSTTINLEEIKNRIKIVDIDISKKDDFNKLENDQDYLFHLGAVSQPRTCQENPELAFNVNVVGTLNTLNFATKSNVKKFIFSSSVLLYGTPKYLPIDENHPLDLSNNFYSLTKKIGEDLCDYYSTVKNLPAIYLRFSNMFGPKQASDYIIPTIIIQAIKDKKIEVWNDQFVRDFTFISDTIDALITSVESDFIGGPVNISSGSKIKIAEVATNIAGYTNATISSLNKSLSSPLILHCANDLAKKTLGWSPNVSFEEGLKATFDWYKNNLHRF